MVSVLFVTEVVLIISIYFTRACVWRKCFLCAILIYLFISFDYIVFQVEVEQNVLSQSAAAAERSTPRKNRCAIRDEEGLKVRHSASKIHSKLQGNLYSWSNSYNQGGCIYHFEGMNQLSVLWNMYIYIHIT